MKFQDNEKELYEILKKINKDTNSLIVDFFNDIDYELTDEQRETLTNYIILYMDSIQLYRKDKEYYDERNVDSKKIINKAKQEIEYVYGTPDEYRKYLRIFYTEPNNQLIEEKVKEYESTLYFLNNFSNDFRKLKPKKPTKKELEQQIKVYFKNIIKKEPSKQAIINLLASLD